LVVGIGVEDEVAFGGREPAAQGRPVAAVLFVTDDPQPRAHLRFEDGQALAGGVMAAVVHHHDFVGARLLSRRRRRADGALDVSSLVVRWHDEGERGAGHFVPWQKPMSLARAIREP
jgi:hypothetical protein